MKMVFLLPRLQDDKQFYNLRVIVSESQINITKMFKNKSKKGVITTINSETLIAESIGKQWDYNIIIKGLWNGVMFKIKNFENIKHIDLTHLETEGLLDVITFSGESIRLSSSRLNVLGYKEKLIAFVMLNPITHKKDKCVINISQIKTIEFSS